MAEPGLVLELRQRQPELLQALAGYRHPAREQRIEPPLRQNVRHRQARIPLAAGMIRLTGRC